MDEPRRPSQELHALQGPVDVITRVEDELARLLQTHMDKLVAQIADALERRAAVKPELYPDDERTMLIGSLRIAATSSLLGFKRESRKIVSQGLLDAYTHNRYPTTVQVPPREDP